MTLRLVAPTPEQERDRARQEASAALRHAVAKLRDYEAVCSLTRDVAGRNTAHSVASGVEELTRRLEGGAFVRRSA